MCDTSGLGLQDTTGSLHSCHHLPTRFNLGAAQRAASANTHTHTCTHTHTRTHTCACTSFHTAISRHASRCAAQMSNMPVRELIRPPTPEFIKELVSSERLRATTRRPAKHRLISPCDACRTGLMAPAAAFRHCTFVR